MAKRASVDSLETTLSARVGELRGLVKRAVSAKADVKAVHQARVATRRLKAAIDLAEPVLSAEPRKEFARALRRLRRALGPVRDLDVMLGHLKELSADERHGEAVAWITRQLRSQRKELKGDCCGKLTSRGRLKGLQAWKSLAAELTESETAIRKEVARAVPTQLARFRDLADAVTQSREGTAGSTQAAPDVHELRIAGKLLRYTIELAEELGYQLSPSILKSFKRLQDELGYWHDYVVLGGDTLRTAADEMLALHRPRLYGAILEFSHSVWQLSEKHLDRFDRLWTESGEQLAADIMGAIGPKDPMKPAKASVPQNGNPATSHAPGHDDAVAKEPS